MFDMAKSAQAAVAWLALVAFGGVYAKIDGWLSDPVVAQPDKGLPFLQDIYYQGALWGTSERMEGPSWSHLLGTDTLGRDVFARIVTGGWNVLGLAVVAVTVAALIGVFIGWVAAKLDERRRGFFEWILEVLDAFPAVVVLLVVVSLYGPQGLFGAGVVLGVVVAPSFIRSVRRVVIGSTGTGPVHDVRRSIAVVIGGLALANGALIVGIDAVISFLGFSGAQPNWGAMVNEARAESVRRMFLLAIPIALTAAACDRLAMLVAERGAEHEART